MESNAATLHKSWRPQPTLPCFGLQYSFSKKSRTTVSLSSMQGSSPSLRFVTRHGGTLRRAGWVAFTKVTDFAFTSDFCKNYSHPASPASLYLTSPRPRPTRPRVPYLMSSSPSSRVPKSQVPTRASLCPRRLVPVPLLYTANYKYCSSDTELNKPSIESRTVTSRYHGSSISRSQNGELKQQRRRCQRDWQKQSVYISKTTTLLHVLYTFFYFSAVVARLRLETS